MTADETDPPAVDFGRQSDDYAEHRPGFPASFYERLHALAPLAPGIEALDVATGPAVIALELAARGAAVTGIDISANQIAVAARRAEAAGLADRCRFLVAAAEDTGLEAGRFDLAVAGQCWHWFDPEAAMREMLRVLAPGGTLVVAHHSYLALHSRVARATEDLILEHNPAWTMAGSSGMYPEHIDSLVLGGFELLEQFCYDHEQPFTHASWRGRMRTCNGVGSGGLTDEQVARFDDALAELLRREWPREPLLVRHRVWATVVRRP
jgi:SAM-dependent methyltransferase